MGNTNSRNTVLGQYISTAPEDKGSTQSLTLADVGSSKQVGLCSKQITELTDAVEYLIPAQVLLLCCNQLKSLPREIGCLRNLTVLSLYKNQLQYLPEELFSLTKLKELDVSENQLTHLSRSIGNLTRLHTLSLEHNQLPSLPMEIGKLKDLSTLKLTNNPLSILPAEIAQLKGMKHLILIGCPLVPAIVFSEETQIPSLKELSARFILRHKIPINGQLTQDACFYLESAHECSHCKGPFFETYTQRGKVILRGDQEVPIEYRLCSAHWSSEQGRITSLFTAPPSTAPSSPARSRRVTDGSMASIDSSSMGELVQKLNLMARVKRTLSRSTSLATI